jgi:uncharacterized protein with HEPN domain
MAATRNPRVRLLHILDEIDGIAASIADASFDQYRASYQLRRTAERAVQIVSEAARTLPSDLIELNVIPRLPGVRSSGSATSCAMSIRKSTIAGFGTS